MAGLDRLPRLLPVRGGYLEGQLGASSITGPYLRAEGGLRPREDLSLFGFGQWTPRESSAGLGVRVTF